jgi:hypothetical protein
MNLPCYHVTTAQGHIYGVTAQGAVEAKLLTQLRLTREGQGDTPVRAQNVGTWDADYGTVLCYS